MKKIKCNKCSKEFYSSRIDGKCSDCILDNLPKTMHQPRSLQQKLKDFEYFWQYIMIFLVFAYSMVSCQA